LLSTQRTPKVVAITVLALGLGLGITFGLSSAMITTAALISRLAMIVILSCAAAIVTYIALSGGSDNENVPYIPYADWARERPAPNFNNGINWLAVNHGINEAPVIDVAYGLNVHENNRDQKTKDAIVLLRAAQGAIDQQRIDAAVHAFTAFINAQNRDVNSAREWLQELLRDNHCMLGISGREITGRLWIYADTYRDPIHDEMLSARERANVKLALVRALAHARRENSCNQGTVQMMVVAALQGRLPGVNLDEMPPVAPTRAAVEMFFNVQRHQAIETRNELLVVANAYCQVNPGIERLGFLAEMNNYADQQGMD